MLAGSGLSVLGEARSEFTGTNNGPPFGLSLLVLASGSGTPSAVTLADRVWSR
jgi:hypothetical protein